MKPGTNIQIGNGNTCQSKPQDHLAMELWKKKKSEIFLGMSWQNI